MNDRILFGLYRIFIGPLLALVAVHIIGTVGYRIIGGPQVSLLDCLYMTFITVATIGYGEIVDLAHSPEGRIFTMLLGTLGIGIMSYGMAKMTTFLVAGELNEALRRRKMLKQVANLHGHYIVCGIGRVGSNVAHELSTTERKYVVVDTNQHNIDTYRERYPDTLYLHGDGSEDDILTEAGVATAAGVFAVTGDDAKNLVITLSAKQLNPATRVVARCHEVNYIEKIRRVGADAIVSPDFTGGMRIASSMIRPHVVNFLDEMLRADHKLRVEEVRIPESYPGARLGDLDLRGRDFMLMAVHTDGRIQFNPDSDYALKGGDALIVMTTPDGRMALESRFAD